MRRFPGRRTLRQAVSLLVLQAFLLPTLTFAFTPTVYQDESGTLAGVRLAGKTVRVDPKLGRVVGTHTAADGPFVFFIHDLHCNYEVQGNIAALLEEQARRHGLRLVGIEGESRRLDVSKLSTFPLEEVKRNAGDYFLRRGRITGPEYLAALGAAELDLEGIEDQALYDQNRNTLFEFLNQESQGYCEDLRTVLNNLKGPVYSVELAKLDHLRQEYEFESVTLETYASKLLAEAKRQGLALDPFPLLRLFAAQGRLPLTTETDHDRLLADVRALDRAVRERLYTSPDQRQLDRFLQVVDIIESMVSISATTRELEDFRAHRDQFAVAGLVGFVDQLCYRFAMNCELDTNVLKLEDFLRRADAFYRVADERSEAFVNNLMARMDAAGERVGAMVIGGFHAEGVEAALRRRGVSYAAVKPRITRTYADNPYFSLLRNQREPLEKILAQGGRILAPTSAFGDAGFLRYLDVVLKTELARFLAVSGDLRGEALDAAFREVVARYPANDEALQVYPDAARSRPEDGIYVLPIAGTSFTLVVRKSEMVAERGYEVVAEEEIAGGYKFQVLDNQVLEAHQDEILGPAAAARGNALARLRAGLAARLRPAADGVRGAGEALSDTGARLRAGWTAVRQTGSPAAFTAAFAGLRDAWTQRREAWRARLGGLNPSLTGAAALGAGGVLAATLIMGLPATAAVVALQFGLLAVAAAAVYVLTQQRRLPAWARAAANLGLAALSAGFFLQAAPAVQQLAQLFQGEGGVTTASLGARAMAMPVVGLLASWFARGGELYAYFQRQGQETPPAEDRIARAMAWARGYGYGLSLEQPGFRASLEQVLSLVESAESEEDRRVLAQVSESIPGLAVLGIAYHQGRAAVAPTIVAGSPRENLLAQARDWSAAEALADAVLSGQKLTPELMRGESHLARMVRAGEVGRRTFALGEEDRYRPERLLPEAFTPRQVEAMRQYARRHNLAVTVHGPVFNTILGYHPGTQRAVEAYQKLADLARGLGAEALVVRTLLTPDSQAAVAAYATGRRRQAEVAVSFAGETQAPAEELARREAAREAVDEMVRSGALAPPQQETRDEPGANVGSLQQLPAAAGPAGLGMLLRLPAGVPRILRVGVLNGLWAGMTGALGTAMVWVAALGTTGRVLSRDLTRSVLSQLVRAERSPARVLGILGALEGLPGEKMSITVRLMDEQGETVYQGALPAYLINQPGIISALLRIPGISIYNMEGERITKPERRRLFGSAA